MGEGYGESEKKGLKRGHYTLWFAHLKKRHVNEDIPFVSPTKSL